jgi:hypothetical protein
MWIVLACVGAFLLLGGCCVIFGVVIPLIQKAREQEQKAREAEMKAQEQAQLPAMVVISSNHEIPLGRDPVARFTMRNKGGSGTVLFIIRQGGQQWKRQAYFDAGEQREVRFAVPGLQAGEFWTDFVPAANASRADLNEALPALSE